MEAVSLLEHPPSRRDLRALCTLQVPLTQQECADLRMVQHNRDFTRAMFLGAGLAIVSIFWGALMLIRSVAPQLLGWPGLSLMGMVLMTGAAGLAASIPVQADIRWLWR